MTTSPSAPGQGKSRTKSGQGVVLPFSALLTHTRKNSRPIGAAISICYLPLTASISNENIIK